MRKIVSSSSKFTNDSEITELLYGKPRDDREVSDQASDRPLYGSAVRRQSTLRVKEIFDRERN